MATKLKTYDFRIVVRRAEFKDGMVATIFGGQDTVYLEKNVEMTLADALKEQERVSKAETRAHSASLTMRYRDDRKPPRFADVRPMFGGEGA